MSALTDFINRANHADYCILECTCGYPEAIEEAILLQSENKRLKEEQLQLINAALSWRQSWPDEEDEQGARDGDNDSISNLIRACDLYKEYGKD